MFRAFLSYSRDGADLALAQMLRDRLAAHDIVLNLDTGISVGTFWVRSLAEQIQRASAVLVLATPRAMNRPWVQQELGFSVAMGKPIVPINLTGEDKLDGLLAEFQMLQHLDWSNVETAVGSIAECLKRARSSQGSQHGPRLMQTLPGLAERTRHLNQVLKEVHDDLTRGTSSSRETPKRAVRLADRSALTIFSIPPRHDPDSGFDSQPDLDQLCRQRRLMEDLLSDRRTILWLHAFPPSRHYPPKLYEARKSELLFWLRELADDPDRAQRVHLTCEPHAGPNTLAILDYSVLQGYRAASSGELETTLVKWDQEAVKLAFNEIHDTVHRNELTPTEAAERIERFKNPDLRR